MARTWGSFMPTSCWTPPHLCARPPTLSNEPRLGGSREVPAFLYPLPVPAVASPPNERGDLLQARWGPASASWCWGRGGVPTPSCSPSTPSSTRSWSSPHVSAVRRETLGSAGVGALPPPCGSRSSLRTRERAFSGSVTTPAKGRSLAKLRRLESACRGAVGRLSGLFLHLTPLGS